MKQEWRADMRARVAPHWLTNLAQTASGAASSLSGDPDATGRLVGLDRMSTKDLPVDCNPLGIAPVPGAVMQLPTLRLREDVGAERRAPCHMHLFAIERKAIEPVRRHAQM